MQKQNQFFNPSHNNILFLLKPIGILLGLFAWWCGVCALLNWPKGHCAASLEGRCVYPPYMWPTCIQPLAFVSVVFINSGGREEIFPVWLQQQINTLTTIEMVTMNTINQEGYLLSWRPPSFSPNAGMLVQLVVMWNKEEEKSGER